MKFFQKNLWFFILSSRKPVLGSQWQKGNFVFKLELCSLRVVFDIFLVQVNSKFYQRQQTIVIFFLMFRMPSFTNLWNMFSELIKNNRFNILFVPIEFFFADSRKKNTLTRIFLLKENRFALNSYFFFKHEKSPDKKRNRQNNEKRFWHFAKNRLHTYKDSSKCKKASTNKHPNYFYIYMLFCRIWIYAIVLYMCTIYGCCWVNK